MITNQIFSHSGIWYLFSPTLQIVIWISVIVPNALNKVYINDIIQTLDTLTLYKIKHYLLFIITGKWTAIDIFLFFLIFQKCLVLTQYIVLTLRACCWTTRFRQLSGTSWCTCCWGTPGPWTLPLKLRGRFRSEEDPTEASELECRLKEAMGPEGEDTSATEWGCACDVAMMGDAVPVK